ncbi:MAG: outer membrane lipoprotein chaperone LolA [Betaproteobacteria bacterium]
MRCRVQFAAVALALGCSAATADGLDSLERFVKGVKSGQAEFTQVVSAPARAGETAKTRTSSGSFAFSRPDRFRFDYRKPFVQTIVADGTTLWMYDADLNQVTARKQADVLGATPAALIASAPDLAVLRNDYVLKAEPDRDGLQWVLATPRAKDGQLQSVRVGLRAGEGAPTLAVLDILDSFGQRSELRFAQVEANPALPTSLFQFKPPAGADVIRQ